MNLILECPPGSALLLPSGTLVFLADGSKIEIAAGSIAESEDGIHRAVCGELLVPADRLQPSTITRN